MHRLGEFGEFYSMLEEDSPGKGHIVSKFISQESSDTCLKLSACIAEGWETSGMMHRVWNA